MVRLFKYSIGIYSLCFLIALSSCVRGNKTPINKYFKPHYGNIGLVSTGDTLSFKLDDSTYNDIKSFNVFVHKGTEYICFYDKRSKTINIYQFSNQKRIGKIELKKWFKGQSLYRESVFIKNFDSIYVAKMDKVYLLNRKGKKIGSVEYIDHSLGVFENSNIPVFRNGKLYMAVMPGMDYTSLNALKKWKIVYELDIANKRANLHYKLPELYQTNLFGSQFMGYNFCSNDHGRFVFSFPADTNIYETDFDDYHMSYYAKSNFQKDRILPISKEQLIGDAAYKEYKLRDVYGAIYFDPYRRRYLRLAKQKITLAAFEDNQPRKQTVIIFDDSLRIIGESYLSSDFSFNSIIFCSNGNMYVRVNYTDEQAIHFVKIVYKEEDDGDLNQVTRVNTKIINKQP